MACSARWPRPRATCALPNTRWPSPIGSSIVRATDKTRLADYAQNIPAEKYHKEELELINGVYPEQAAARWRIHQGCGVAATTASAMTGWSV